MLTATCDICGKSLLHVEDIFEVSPDLKIDSKVEFLCEEHFVEINAKLTANQQAARETIVAETQSWMTDRQAKYPTKEDTAAIEAEKVQASDATVDNQ